MQHPNNMSAPLSNVNMQPDSSVSNVVSCLALNSWQTSQNSYMFSICPTPTSNNLQIIIILHVWIHVPLTSQSGLNIISHPSMTMTMMIYSQSQHQPMLRVIELTKIAGSCHKPAGSKGKEHAILLISWTLINVSSQLSSTRSQRQRKWGCQPGTGNYTQDDLKCLHYMSYQSARKDGGLFGRSTTSGQQAIPTLFEASSHSRLYSSR